GLRGRRRGPARDERPGRLRRGRRAGRLDQALRDGCRRGRRGRRVRPRAPLAGGRPVDARHLTNRRSEALDRGMEASAWTVYERPLGPLTVEAGEFGVRSVRFPGRGPRRDPSRRRRMPGLAAQLDEYFAGERHAFDVPVELAGSPLQLAVWERLREIPYGE